ncbi:MAG: aminodeoxychorismate lyase [Propionicimonas sp.]
MKLARHQILAVLGRGVVPVEMPLLSADDLGVTRGDGCFDAARVTTGPDGPRVHYLAEHLARLIRSADALGIDAPPSAEWESLVGEALQGWTGPADAVCKFVLTRGLESRPSRPVGYLTITTAADATQARRGVTAVTLDRGYRSDAFADAPWLLGGVKTLSYAVNVAAKREAAALGVDEAIFRSSDGYLLEGPTAGLLFSSEDQLWTIPFESTGVLPSVTIAAIFEAARSNGVDAGQRMLTCAEAADCDGLWLVSAIRGVLPVLSLDGQPLRHDPEVTGVLATAVGFGSIN